MLTYSQLETALARVYGADEIAQAGVFRGRLAHLRRLGIPVGIKPGRGRHIEYDETMVWQWALCLELCEFGVDPIAIVELVEKRWRDSLLGGFKNAAAEADRKKDTYLVITVRQMSAKWSDEPNVGGMVTIGFLEEKDLGLSLPHRLSTARPHRAMVINVSNLLRKLHRQIDKVMREAART
jgi:hypothetical protein